MNTHFASPYVDLQGNWTKHNELYNTTSDVSCTAGQMGRALGLALASKKYKELHDQIGENQFSNNGQEVCFSTIGDASTSEGAFWESINAAGVMRIPFAISIWDDGYGISVPSKYQTTKQSISEVLEGFRVNEKGEGLDIYCADGWNYPQLVELYKTGIEKVRTTHIPAVFHIENITQPQGHSTSGSHERYKPTERLEFERDFDCNVKFRQWILDEGMATEEELRAIEEEARRYVRDCKQRAWKAFAAPNKRKLEELQGLYQQIITETGNDKAIVQRFSQLNQLVDPQRSELYKNGRQMLIELGDKQIPTKAQLKTWLEQIQSTANEDYHTNLYSQTPHSALKVAGVEASYSDKSKKLPGYQVINEFFKLKMNDDPRIIAFGEDVGQLGDVNQGFAGLQEIYGEERVFDTGIREWTIIGQAIGLAMRGLRPIAEIQYLDYLVYAMAPLTDDLATLRFRTDGIQAAPAIVRSRGHRLEGIWHAGSPMGLLINSLRGMYICVPRNMVQAAGFYNTMLKSDDPALIIECLNGYRLR
ncbi:MAG: thiamine pyrophosphate-dependent enzyme, partial [Bacteroidota bacterium]